ncbi:Shikimate dehydrogenase (NADP(+)) [uncultured archaeon]|nr:Shikimate dehydrogenase (NADP(+)) [uncultured archaeon]
MGLKELLEQRKARIALLPEKNDYLLTSDGRGIRGMLGKVEVEELYRKMDSEPSRYVDLSRLDSLSGYLATLIAHDYSAMTPQMWNTVYEKNGINIRNIMVVANPKDIQEIFSQLKSDKKYLGGGAGVGFKDAILSRLDKTVPSDISSSNIIVNENGALVGYNTDAEGLMRSMNDRAAKLKISLDHVVVVGAGGVAKQFTRQLIASGVKHVSIVNRTVEKARAIAESLNAQHGEGTADAYGEDEIGRIFEKSVPDAFVNTSDKGGDSLPDGTMFSGGTMETARDVVRLAKAKNPRTLYVDILLTKGGTSSGSLRLLSSEGIGNEYLLDGKPMVLYQAIPAYRKVEKAHLGLHVSIGDGELLEMFSKSVMVNLPRDEMAFRQIYFHLLRSRSLTTVFRPRDMIKDSVRSYSVGDRVTARVLKNVGVDWAKVPPVFLDGEEFPLQITEVTAKRIGDLSIADFEGSSPDVKDRNGLIYQLGLIYNLSVDELSDDTIVTRIEFEYLE